MTELAIKGHPTRGKEVIEILEMLGGKTRRVYTGTEGNWIYTLKNGNIIGDFLCDGDNCIIFTLEEFLERFPYKVGDKVKTIYGKIGIISKPIWSNRDECIRYELEADTDSFYFVNELQPYKEETMEEQKAIPPYMDYDVRTEKDMEEKLLNAETYFKIWNKTDNGYEVVVNDNYELKQIDNHFYIKKKQPQYPKTYEECCKVLFPNSIAIGKVLTSGYNCELLKKFGELLICRDAYWKIAGEQMGLGEPWKPNWSNDLSKYYISFYKNKVDKGVISYSNQILAFPTEEMRDTFFDNFKELIEQCKELL